MPDKKKPKGAVRGQAGLKIDLSIAEVYEAVCEDCQKELRELVRSKISDQMVDQVLGEAVGEP